MNVTEVSLDKAYLQTAIAASTVTVYFVVLAMAIFLSKGEEQTPISEQLVSSFTTVVSVVTAFYFGSSAYERTRDNK